MEERTSVEVVQGAGLNGCAHAQPGGKRQVLLVDAETLLEFHQVRSEKISPPRAWTSMLCRIGQRLCVGEVALEVSAVCHPCEQIEALRPGLQAKLEGRRGMLCRVLSRGTLRRGDLIQLQEKTPTTKNPSAG